MECSWKAPDILVVQLGRGSNFVPGDYVQFLKGYAINTEPYLRALDDRKEIADNKTTALTHRIEFPDGLRTVLPEFSLQSSSSIGMCETLRISIASSFGSFGRPLRFRWTLIGKILGILAIFSIISYAYYSTRVAI